MTREESALKLLGVENPEIFSGKKINSDIEVCFAGDFVIFTFAPQGTNVVLDDLQMNHFLHRYFKKNKTGENSKPEEKTEEKK